MCVRGVVRLEWRKFLRAICFWWRRRVSIDSSLVQSSSITYLDPGHKFIGFIRPRLLKSTYFFIHLKILVSLCTFLGKHTWCWQFHKSIPVKYKCIQVLHMMYFYVVREIYALTGLICVFPWNQRGQYSPSYWAWGVSTCLWHEKTCLC